MSSLEKLHYKKGRKEGRQEGRQEGVASSVVRVLTSRLGDVPEGLRDRVIAIQDTVVLDRLLGHAATDDSIEQFEERLPKKPE